MLTTSLIIFSKELAEALKVESPEPSQPVIKLLAFRPYSSHPDDHYLSVVLRINEKSEYVTHVFNSSDGGYSLGHYHGGNITAALEDFNKRGAA